jgi:hyperosmotically inducible protein
MDKRSSVTLMAAALAAGALFGAGCSDRSSTGSVSEKIDRTTDQMSVAADSAAARAAAASDDGTVTVKVKGALMTDPALKPLEIQVSTEDGVVTLAGAVDSPVQKERATQIAQSVSGVQSVVDNLTVKSTG